MIRSKCSFIFSIYLLIWAVALSSVESFAAVEKDDENARPVKLDIAPILEEANYERDNLFAILKQNRIFATLVQKYRIDDPAKWSALRSRMGVRAIDALRTMQAAELMTQAKDTRSNLDGRLLSAEKTRKRGHEELRTSREKYRETQLVTDLLNQLQGKLKEVSEKKALTGVFEIKNHSGKSFMGRIVMLDGESSIVQMESGAFFRVPMKVFAAETKRIIEESQMPGEPEDAAVAEADGSRESKVKDESEPDTEIDGEAASRGEESTSPEESGESSGADPSADSVADPANPEETQEPDAHKGTISDSTRNR